MRNVLCARTCFWPALKLIIISWIPAPFACTPRTRELNIIRAQTHTQTHAQRLAHRRRVPFMFQSTQTCARSIQSRRSSCPPMRTRIISFAHAVCLCNTNGNRFNELYSTWVCVRTFPCVSITGGGGDRLCRSRDVCASHAHPSKQ